MPRLLQVSFTLGHGEDEARTKLTPIVFSSSDLLCPDRFPIAKLADVFGRAQGYAISLTLYVIGFIILASSQRFSDMCAGTIFYACGSSGIQIMQQIVL